jgi:hypothetical protein
MDRVSGLSSSSKVVRFPANGAIIRKAGIPLQSYLLILKNALLATAALESANPAHYPVVMPFLSIEIHATVALCV